jgi:hypothetical protein
VYGRELLTPYSLWIHRKGGLYIFLSTSVCSTNGEGEDKEVVVYWSCTHKAERHRDIDEFLDGRFIPTQPDGIFLAAKQDVSRIEQLEKEVARLKRLVGEEGGGY